MGVDRHWRCYVVARFVDATPVPQLAAVWIHEVAHLLRDHHGRAGPAARRRRSRPAPGQHRAGLRDQRRPDRRRAAAARRAAGARDCSACRTGCCSRSTAAACRPRRSRPRLRVGGATGSRPPWESRRRRRRRWSARSRRRRDPPRPRRPSAPTCAPGAPCPAAGSAGPTGSSSRRSTGGRCSPARCGEAVAWAGGAVDYTYRRPSRRRAALRGVVLPSLRRPAAAGGDRGRHLGLDGRGGRPGRRAGRGHRGAARRSASAATG